MKQLTSSTGLRQLSRWSLAFVLASQMTMGAVQAKPQKVRSATGMITMMSDNGVLTLAVNKKRTEQFKVSDQIEILQEEIVNQKILKPELVVRITGKGQKNTVVANEIKVLKQQKFKSVKSKKPGSAYGQQEKATSIKVKIIEQRPLKVKNYYGQMLQVQTTEQTVVVQEKVVDTSTLVNNTKAKIVYTESNGQLVAKQIILPVAMHQQAKK